MTQLEALKMDVAALTERINSAMSEDSVTLTREQLKEFAQAIQEDTIEKVKGAIEGVNIEVADHVTIDLNRLELEINVETYDVLSEIVNSMLVPDDVTDEDVVRYLDIVKK